MACEMILFFILNLIIALSFGIIAYQKLSAPGGKSIFFLAVSLITCSFSSTYGSSEHGVITDTILSITYLVGATIAVIAMFTFSSKINHHSTWLNPYSLLLLSIIPFISQIFYWIPENSFSFFPRLQAFFSFGKQNFSLLFNQFFSIALLANAVWVLIPASAIRYGKNSLQFWASIASPLAALIVILFTPLSAIPPSQPDSLLLVAIGASLVGFSIYAFNSDARDDIFRFRGDVVEQMKEGWIIVDQNNIVTDINQVTIDFFGLPKDELLNQPITSLWSDFPDFEHELTASQKIDLERAYKVNDQWRYLNIYVSKMEAQINAPNSHLIIWRDISSRRQTENARQHARDEMFLLMNAISSAASQATNLSDFLSEVIYQIIYPFRSQVVLIYILDERLNQENKYGNNLGNGSAYFLAAYMGLDTEQSKDLNSFPSSHALFSWLDENRKHILLDDIRDRRIPEPMQSLPTNHFLIIPLINQNVEGQKLIGSIMLGRKDIPNYNQDEIVRLSLLIEQLAILIDSDHRRKLAILLSERQRLMRDIHDSVSQKLYGLVAQTEAAKAAIEANSTFDFTQMITRINENARQAVRELRLLLFQMRPFDVEKEGLISVLHHRLAAVEGRADIKTKFLADDVSLSKREEVALYYIAQEALNNVLRHAQAKSVTVTLSQSEENVVLEVVDDGRGFSPENVALGGLGLKNIEERVKQLDGKLELLSKPGDGTTIIITIEKDVRETKKMTNQVLNEED